MKRKLLLFALVLLVMVSSFAVMASATDLPVTCEHCNTAVTWKPLDASLVSQGTIAEGHYYLDFTETSLTVSKITISDKVCLHMNGKTLQAKDDRVFDVSGELSLIGEGTVLGRAFTSDKAGGAIYVPGLLNVYGPTISTTAESGRYATNGGVIYVTGTVNMHSGTITGGSAVKNGGSVCVAGSGKFIMNGGSITKGKASNAGGLVYGETNTEMTFTSGTVSCDITNSTTKCVFTRGQVNLSGSANISQIRLTKVADKKLTIRGEYVGTTQITYTSTTNDTLMDGDVIGVSENADMTEAKITIYERACYVVADGNDLKISFAKPAGRRTAYCDYCQKTVEWIGLTESDRRGGDMETGHYFLDFMGDSCEFATMNLKSYNRMCLDLNGKHLDSTDRAFRLYSGILNIMDSSDGQTGLITGRGTTDSSPTGGVIRVQADAELNLYSGNISYQKATDGRNRVVRGGVVYVAGGKFNMYGGKIYGGNAKYGANVAVWNDSTNYGSFYMSGGEIGDYLPENGATTKGTGVFSNCYVTLSGSPTISNLYFVEDDAATFDEMLTVDGKFTGNVVVTFSNYRACRAIGYGKNADFSDANITVTNAASLKLVAYGNKLIFTTGLPYVVETNGTATAYQTLQEAIDAYTEGKIVLLSDVSVGTAVSVDKDIYLDLNGFSFNGSVSGSGTVRCMDSCTDDYTVADGIYGKIPTAVTNVVSADGYFEIVEDNIRSFHRLDLKIKNVTLRTTTAGLYYQCDFAGDEMIKAKITYFGIALNTKEAPAAGNMDTTSLYTSITGSAFNTDVANSVLLSDILKARNTAGTNNRNTAMRVYGRAYILAGDEYIYGDTVSCSLAQVLAAVNANWSKLGVKQKQGFVTMYERFTATMEPYSSSFKSTYETIQTRNAKDYSAYLCPWTENVVETAKADGKLHYYFMAGEGGEFSSGSYNEKWGDSYLLVFPNGQTMLIDSGYSSYGPVLTQNLRRMGVEKLDYLVITHPHADHQGGSFYEVSLLNMEYGLVNCFEIGQVYYRGGYDPETSAATYVPMACEQLKLPCEALEKGDVLNIGGVRMDVIWPMAGEGDTIVNGGVEINDKSVVFRVEYGEHTALLTGDLYVSGEEGILANTDIDVLDVDLLKVPHHGYDSTSSLPAFIKTVSPEIAVAIGRVPREASISRYENLGVEYLCDWLNGYIHINVGEDGVMTETHTRNNVPADFGDIKDDDSDIEGN